MSYNKKIIYYYNNRLNVGFLNLNKNYGFSLIGAPLCGDLIELQLYIINDLILSSRYKTYGCASAIASVSLLSSYIIGKNINHIFFTKNIHISQELSLPLIKIHCSVLVEDILKLSIINFKNNYLIF
ncbi:Iron-sulfur cluster assembly scaffold protein IscU [Candidatus Nasuia deltocephalinicola]|nr:Iron-sulfur cluster assembly scaffold protein IscU [Candidatus Nasuia deltocephalinicola]